jgi:hypothetical protein
MCLAPVLEQLAACVFAASDLIIGELSPFREKE